MLHININVMIYSIVLAVAWSEQAQVEYLLSGTLSVIFKNIFKPRAMSVSIIGNISDYENYRFGQDTLQSVLSFNKKMEIPVAINQYTSTELAHYTHVKIVFTNNARNIRIRMEQIFHQNEFQSNSLKYVVILKTNTTLEEKLYEMHLIFEDFFNLYIIDVVILVHVDNLLHMYNYRPYNKKHCAFTKPLLLQSFDKVPDFLSYDDLYPIKIRNFYQCPIKVVLWNIPPFMELKLHQNQSLLLKGYDARILIDLATFLNFSIEVMPNEPPNFLSGEVYRNKTAIGVFNILFQRRANITIGSISCLPRRLQLTSGSMPYFVNELVIVLKNTKNYTSIQLLLRPFKKSVWLFFLTILILKPIAKRLLRIPNNSCYDKLQHLFRLQWLFLIFLLRASYEGSMYQAIRNSPFQALPQTLSEVVHQNYTLITDYATARLLHEITFLRDITQIVNDTQLGVLESIDNLPYNYGVITYDSAVAMFMKNRLKNHSHYAIVRDKVANTMKCIFFPRLSYMTGPVNFYIKQFALFGIFHKYMKDLEYENLPFTTDHLRRKSKTNTQIPLDFQFFKAVFTSMAILHLVAIVIFILEFVSERYKLLLNIFHKYYEH